MENSIGPRTEPCGAPEVQWVKLDWAWPTLTNWSIGEVRCEPAKYRAGNAKTIREPVDKNFVVDGVEGSTEVQRH